MAVTWIPVATVDECVEGSAHIVNVNGKEVGIIRAGASFFAVLNYCPHSGAPVCRGRVTGRVVCDADGVPTYDGDAKTLRCPWHHWEFDLASGKPVAPIRERLKVYPTRVVDDRVFISLSSDENVRKSSG